MRTNILEEEEDPFMRSINTDREFKNKDTGFFTSRRIKLDLPHNYYPGPGKYDIRRFLETNENP